VRRGWGAESEINECYRQLRALAASPSSTEYEYARARLAALQEAEARWLSDVCRTNVDD